MTGIRKPGRQPKKDKPAGAVAKPVNENYVQYSDEVALEICALRSEGMSLRAICRMKGMPSNRTIILWRRKSAEFAEMYRLASEDCADAHVTDIEDIAERVLSGKLDPQAARVAIDAKKWVACKLKNKAYGDKLHTELSGPNQGPIQFQNVEELTDEQLAAIAAGRS